MSRWILTLVLVGTLIGCSRNDGSAMQPASPPDDPASVSGTGLAPGVAGGEPQQGVSAGPEAVADGAEPGAAPADPPIVTRPPEPTPPAPEATAPQYTADQMRAALVANYTITLHRNAAACEKMKRAGAQEMAQSLRTSGVRGSSNTSKSYWPMWKHDQDTSNLPDIPKGIVRFKKKFMDSLLEGLGELRQESLGLAPSCKDAMSQAALRAAKECIETGEPRSPEWLLKVGEKCYVKGVAVH